MSKVCEHCGKGSQKSATRSHSKIKTLRRQYANLQKFEGKKYCTRCIRTASKQTA
ncbi:MAG: 50S ribosomal protein L28 [Candidatus Magasanikbacteria bacterium]|nr:50S ribosomal protein L28 [Candidatus Magasanikbacteria bacterium]